MKIEEIIATMKKFGLSDYEARVYTYLNLMGPSKAGEISRESGVPQAKIYSVLESLMRKNLVQLMETKPKIFRAIDFKEGFDIILSEKLKEIEMLKLLAKDLAKVKRNEEQVGYGIWSLNSKKRNEFFDTVCKMIRKSKKYVFGVSRDFSRYSKLDFEIKKAIKRGVKIYLLGFNKPNEESYHRALGYAKLGVQIRIFQTNIHPRIVLVDGKEILFRLDYDPYQKEGFRFTYFWSEDPSLVRVFDQYLKMLWKRAKKLQI